MLLSDHVLFIDGEAIVIDKPSGLPVDRPRDGGLSVENHLSGLTFGFQRWPVPVHRLDRDTSGCLLLARNPKAAARFARAFEDGAVEKVYLAVLAGLVADDEGTVDIPIGKTSSRQEGWRMVPDQAGKPASTAWRRLAARGGRTLIEFRPRTGRTHQLRVHALHGLGTPIAGDPIYGDGRGPMLLHARSLGMPRDGKPAVTAQAPVPATFHEAGFDV